MRQYILLDDYDRETAFDRLKDLKAFAGEQRLTLFRTERKGFYRLESR